MIFLSKVLIFRFHVNFWGSMISFEPMWKTFCFRADDISDIATGPWGRFDRTQRLWEKYSVADAYEASFPWWWSDPWPTLSRWILSILPSEGHYGMRDLQDVFCWVSQLHMFYIPLEVITCNRPNLANEKPCSFLSVSWKRTHATRPMIHCHHAFTPKFPMETCGKYFPKKLTYSNGTWTMNEDDFPHEKWKDFPKQLTRHVSWYFCDSLRIPMDSLKIPIDSLRIPMDGCYCKTSTQDCEVSQRHEDGLHATRGRPWQYQNSLRGRDETKNGGKLAVSLDGGTPISHPKMIIFSRKTHGFVGGNPPF